MLINNLGPSHAEVRAEIRRLQNLLVSHQTLQKAVDEGVFFPVLASNKDADQGELQAAYTEVYASMDDENKKPLTKKKEGWPPADADLKADEEQILTASTSNSPHFQPHLLSLLMWSSVAVSASSTSANLSVGYGPFALSASHSSFKSKSRTKMDSTATGCKISVQVPQIVG
ncbi:hypothetical protein J3F84DRAFT_345153 [Trichoderma pleuroticola]